MMSKQVHHDMTPQELRRVFHVDSHDQGMNIKCYTNGFIIALSMPVHLWLSVPNYEVINLRSIVRRNANDRDIRHVDLSAFGER